MEANDLINDLKTALVNIRNQGSETILISKLESYLSEMETIDKAEKNQAIQNSERNEVIRKFEHDMKVWEVNAPLENASKLKMFESVIEAGQTALKSATLINGGAAVSLLAFLGNLLTKEPPIGTTFPIHALSQAMLIFFLGVGFSGTATAVRYFSQAAYARKKNCQGDYIKWVAITLAILSFGAFFYGGVEAYYAIQPVPLAAPEA